MRMECENSIPLNQGGQGVVTEDEDRDTNGEMATSLAYRQTGCQREQSFHSKGSRRKTLSNVIETPIVVINEALSHPGLPNRGLSLLRRQRVCIQEALACGISKK